MLTAVLAISVFFSACSSKKNTADDGEYEVNFNIDKMKSSENGGCTANVEVLETIWLADDEVQKLKPGDTIDLSKYGRGNVKVVIYEKTGDDRIELDDGITLVKENGKWKIMTYDDDIFSYVKEEKELSFEPGVRLNDEMSPIVFSGEKSFNNIYDLMTEYRQAEGKIKIENGKVTEVTVYYHP